MRVRVKGEEYEGKARTRVTIMNVSPVNFASESASLLQQIKALTVGA